MLLAKGNKFMEDSMSCLLVHVCFIQGRRRTKKQNTNPTPTRILLLTALDWKSATRLMDKLSDSLQLSY